jgi:acetate kinase
VEGMAWCGVEIDETVNRSVKGEGRVSTSASRTDVWSIQVDEAALLAEKAQVLLKGIQ